MLSWSKLPVQSLNKVENNFCWKDDVLEYPGVVGWAGEQILYTTVCLPSLWNG